MGFWRTLKKALASDCDEIGVQFNIGRRTLLAATRRLNDGLPSAKKPSVFKKIGQTSTLTVSLYGGQEKNSNNTTMDVQNHTCIVDLMSMDSFHSTIINLPNSGGGGGGGISKPTKNKNINASQKASQ